MKKRKIKLGVLFLLGFGLPAISQQAIIATGGGTSSNGGTINYSIGQIICTPINTASGSANPGIQLPYEIYVVGVNETNLKSSVSVYPNPFTENLTVRNTDLNKEKLMYKLYDTQGKLLERGQLTSSETRINICALPSGNYILQETKNVQSFKIIKN